MVDDDSEELFFESCARDGEVDHDHLGLHFRRPGRVRHAGGAEEFEVVVPVDLVLA